MLLHSLIYYFFYFFVKNLFYLLLIRGVVDLEEMERDVILKLNEAGRVDNREREKVEYALFR